MRILRKVYCKMPEWALLALFILVVSTPTGCSTIIGGYEHYDMSKSRYCEHIRRAADKLANSGNVKDKSVAAELYGSINELELMDKCIIEYAEEEPELGWYLMMEGDKIHKYYKSSSGTKFKSE